MKKLLSTVLALGLVAGIATTASASYDKFEISGYYSLDGKYVTNYDRTSGVSTTTNDLSSAWYEQDFRIYPKLTVNDKITVNAELRFAEGDWGTANATATGASDVDLHKIYMDYVSPVGKIRVGSGCFQQKMRNQEDQPRTHYVIQHHSVVFH